MLSEVVVDGQVAGHGTRRNCRIRRVGKSSGRGTCCHRCPAIAILAGDLFLGEAEGNFDGSGTSRSQARHKQLDGTVALA